MSYFDNKWNTVLDSYNNPNWFEDLVFNPLDSIVNLNQPLSKFRGEDGASKFRQEYKLYFPDFYEADWDNLDNIANIQKENLDEGLKLLSDQQELSRELTIDRYEDTKARKIESAEKRLDHQSRTSDTDKELIRLKALQSVSQIDSMIAQSGIQSGYHDRLRKIQEDNVKASTNQANWNKYLSAREIKDIESDLEAGLDKQLRVLDAQQDAAYNLKMQDIEDKKATIDQELVLNKINVYDEWKTGHIETLALMPGEKFLYDLSVKDDYQDYLTQQFDIYATEQYQCVTERCKDGTGGHLCHEHPNGEKVCVGDETSNMMYDIAVLELENYYKQAFKNMQEYGDIRTEAEYLEELGVGSWTELIEDDLSKGDRGEDYSQIGRIVTGDPYEDCPEDTDGGMCEYYYTIYTNVECPEGEEWSPDCAGIERIETWEAEKDDADYDFAYSGITDRYAKGENQDMLSYYVSVIGESNYKQHGNVYSEWFREGCLAEDDPNYDPGALLHLGSMCEFESNK